MKIRGQVLFFVTNLHFLLFYDNKKLETKRDSREFCVQTFELNGNNVISNKAQNRERE